MVVALALALVSIPVQPGEQVGQPEGLLARVLRRLEERAQGGVRHDGVDGHGDMRDGVGGEGAGGQAGEVPLLVLMVLLLLLAA